MLKDVSTNRGLFEVACNVMRRGAQRWQQSASGAVAAMLINALLSCGQGNECQESSSRCSDGRALRCEVVEDANGHHTEWVGTECMSRTCKNFDNGAARCVVIDMPSKKCATNDFPLSGTFCDGSEVIECYRGYVTRVYDCRIGESSIDPTAGDGISRVCYQRTERDALCVEESEVDSVCLGGDYTCLDNAYVRCNGGNLTETKTCGELFCISASNWSTCAVTGAPDARCPSEARFTAFCEGNSIVECSLGYRVSVTPCSEESPCLVDSERAIATCGSI
jgi:hypothetical protein